MACLLPTSSGHHKMATPGEKLSSNLLRRNSVRRTKHQAAGKTRSTGDLRLPRCNIRSKLKSSFKEEDGSIKTIKSTGHVSTTLFARASSNSTGSFENETWDEAATTASAPMRVASHKLLKHGHIRSSSDCSQSIPRHKLLNHGHIKSSSDCSQSIPKPIDKKVPLKPSLVSDTSSRSKVNKNVQFTSLNNDINYEVTEDDIKNSWRDIDISGSIESTKIDFHDMVVSFGPTGRFTSPEGNLFKNGKEYMVRIQQRRLIDEMVAQRANLRRSVLEEQARQKREGVIDAEELMAIASKHSKWSVEIAKSSWWLRRT